MSDTIMIGTRIRFTKRLDDEAIGDHPAYLYAEIGDLGHITKVGGCGEGFWARTDAWPHAFGVSRDEFEVITEEVSQP